jgi:hypothetical protein
MSTEQARGRLVDKRTDIWAFGCVLYELLAGRPAFTGDTTSDLIAAILRTEPEWEALPPGISLQLRRALQRCLEKDVKRRLRDIADIRADLDDSSMAITPAAGPVPWTRIALWFVAGFAVAAAGFAGWRLWTRPVAGVRRDISASATDRLRRRGTVSAISPDERPSRSSRRPGKRHIWVRLLAGGSPLQLTHDAVDHERPGGREIRAPSSITRQSHGTGSLWEISALGGPPRRLGPAQGGGDVSHDGRRVAAFQFEEGHSALHPLRSMVQALSASYNCRRPRRTTSSLVS